MTIEIDRDEFARFLHAGGVVRLSEWLAMDDDTRSELAAAGRAVAAERSMMRAVAMSPEGFRDLSRLVDGGDAADEASLADALNEGLARMGGDFR